MTVNDWIDAHMNLVYGRTIRLIDVNTRKGVGDMMMFYMGNLKIEKMHIEC